MMSQSHDHRLLVLCNKSAWPGKEGQGISINLLSIIKYRYRSALWPVANQRSEIFLLTVRAIAELNKGNIYHGKLNIS
jgi:hypothetical protein